MTSYSIKEELLIKSSKGRTEWQQEIYRGSNAEQIEELAQYIRRDCLEITGIKATATLSSDAIVHSVGKAIGVRLEEEDISVGEPLPPSNKPHSPPKIVVRFTRRDVRDRFYSNRREFAGKKIKDIPGIAVDSTSPVLSPSRCHLTKRSYLEK